MAGAISWHGPQQGHSAGMVHGRGTQLAQPSAGALSWHGPRQGHSAGTALSRGTRPAWSHGRGTQLAQPSAGALDQHGPWQGQSAGTVHGRGTTAGVIASYLISSHTSVQPPKDCGLGLIMSTIVWGFLSGRGRFFSRMASLS